MDFTTSSPDVVNLTLMMTNGTESPSQIIPQSSTLQRALGYSLTAVIAVVMIGMGCGVDFANLKAHILKPTGIVVGFVCQFIIMPVLGFALAKIAQMKDLQTVALLIVASCPGGTLSNIATYWSNGDVDLSISMTMISTILGLGMMPLLLFIYSFGFDNSLQVPFSTIGITLALLIFPIAFGMCIKWKYPQYAERILKLLTTVGGLVILAIAIVALVSYGANLVITPTQLGIASVFPGLGMILGYGLSSLVSLIPRLFLLHEQRRTICIETGIQNTQLAGAIIQLSFPFDQAVQIILFPVAYVISQLIWALLWVLGYRIYSWKCKPNEQESNDEEKKETPNFSIENGNVNVAYEVEPTFSYKISTVCSKENDSKSTFM